MVITIVRFCEYPSDIDVIEAMKVVIRRYCPENVIHDTIHEVPIKTKEVASFGD